MAGEELNTPRDFVNDGWQFIRDQGLVWNSYVTNYLSQFEDIDVPVLTFEIPPELNVDLSTFTRPVAPTAPTVSAVSVTMPTAPSLSDVEVPTISDEPTAPNFDAVTYVAPTAPNRALPELPSDTNPALDEIAIPDAPNIVLPDEPSLYALNLPSDFSLTIPEFTATRPTIDFDVPANTFGWTWEDYDPTTIDAIKSRLTEIRVDGLMLPTDVEAAIFDRARAREDVLTAQAVSDIEDDNVIRLRIPSVLGARRVAKARAEGRQRASAASRELAIAQAKEAIEGIKFSLAQGIALEIELVRANTSENELKLRGAQATLEASISLFNARVALHNASVEGFKAEAEVFAARIRAVQAEADVLRTQVEAQKAIADVNKTLVEAYEVRTRAVATAIDVFRAQVEAARARSEMNTQRLEQARLRLQGFEIQVNAWAKEWDGYKVSVDAALGNVQAQEVLANVYGRRVEAWSTRNKAYFDQGRFQIESQAHQLELYRAQLQGAQIDSQLQLAAIDAVLRRYATDAQVYTASAQVSAAESAAQDRNAQMRLEAARLRIETLLSNAQRAADYALKSVDAQIEVTKAKAQIVSQLAASSQSGINFGASYSGNLGWSFSKSASIGYSAEAPEFNSVPPNLNF